jgi:DNA replication initiation complex subunit (GINS family)
MIRRTYRVWLKERSEKDITDLPEGFLEESSSYIAQLRSGYNLLEKSSLRYRLITKELELLCYMLRDLFAIRQRKILNMKPDQREEGVLRFADGGDALQKLLEAIEAQDSILEQIVHGKFEVDREKSEKPATAVVRILKDTPAFVSVDGIEIGPYRVGDIVSMPAPNARILIRQNYAKAIRFPKPSDNIAD